MVGLRRTNACDTCRRRRVKCDEIRPICGQCAKKGRECGVSLPPQLTWVKPSYASRSTPTSIHTPGPQLLALKAKNEEHELVFRELRFALNPDGGSLNPTTKENATAIAENIPSRPNLSPSDSLRARFVESYDWAPVGFHLSSMAAQWSEIPRHLGTSVAMDDAVDCLIRTHQAFTRNFSSTVTSQDNIHTQSYCKALLSLKNAVSGRVESLRSTTLCAIAILSSAEALGRKGTNYNYVRHSGGIVAFLKAAGPDCVQDDLGSAMLKTAVGLTVVDAYMNGRSCLLDDVKWSSTVFGSATFDRSTYPSMRTLLFKAVFHFSSLSSLLVTVRSKDPQLVDGDASKETFLYALGFQRAIRFTRGQLDAVIRSAVDGRAVITERDSTNKNSPLQKINWFGDKLAANAVLYVWASQIQISLILDRMHRHLQTLGAGVWTAEAAERNRLEGVHLSRRVLASLEYVRSLAPLGSMFISYPIVIAWAHVPVQWKGWVLDELQTMTGPMTSCYTEEALDWSQERFTG